MGAVRMDVDAFDLFGVDVAGDMIATIDDQAGLARLGRLVSEHRRRDAGADDKVIVVVLHGNEAFLVKRRNRARRA